MRKKPTPVPRRKKGRFRSDQRKYKIFNKVVVKIAKVMYLNLILHQNEICFLFYLFLIVDIERKQTRSKVIATD